MSKKLTKTCGLCNKRKPVNQFARMTKSSDGLQPNCKACSQTCSREWRLTNADRKAEYNNSPRQKAVAFLSNSLRRYKLLHGTSHGWASKTTLSEVAAAFGHDWPNEAMIAKVEAMIRSKRGDTHLDHIKPLAAKADPLDLGNIQVLDRKLHAAKTKQEKAALKALSPLATDRDKERYAIILLQSIPADQWPDTIYEAAKFSPYMQEELDRELERQQNEGPREFLALAALPGNVFRPETVTALADAYMAVPQHLQSVN